MRKRRLATRYTVDLPLTLTGAIWPEPREFCARDVSKGGLFVRADEEPELFTEVKISVALPWGGAFQSPGRIVHVMSVLQAKDLGVDAGLGIEFQDLNPEQRDCVERLLSWARSNQVQRVIPVRTGSGGAEAVNPIQGYVLGAVDGKRSVEEIAEWLQLEVAPTRKILEELATSGLVTLPKDEEDAEEAPEPLAANAQETPAAAVVRRGLTEEQCDAIDEVHARIRGDHYAVLGVAPSANQEAIRSAFAALAQTFHSSGYVNVNLGAYERKLHAVVDRVRNAYAALSTSTGRAEYDEYLRRSASLAPPPSATAPTFVAPLPRSSPLPRTSPVPGSSPLPPAASAAQGSEWARRVARVASPEVERLRASQSDQRRTPAPPEAAAPVDIVMQYLTNAARAFESGDVQGADRALDLLSALEWDRPELRGAFDLLESRVYGALAAEYEKQARYEHKHQRWKRAARSWIKVCRGRPNDAECHLLAAEALVALEGQLHKARGLAQRAVTLAPRNAQARRLLGHILLETGLHQSARRELEVAAALNGGDAATRELLVRAQGNNAESR